MWSRVRRAGVVTALVLPCSLTAVQSAHAALGGAPMSPPADASVSSRKFQPADTVGERRDALGIRCGFFRFGFRVLYRS